MHTFQSILLITTNADKDALEYCQIDLNQPNVDTLIIRPDPSIGIETIRTLHPFISRRPLKNTSKHIVFIDAHTLTPEAQNALLKLLEEPPNYLTTILISPHTHAFLDTILSRCRIIHTHTVLKTNTKESSELSKIVAVSPAERLKLVPTNTKSKEAAIVYCTSLITEAETMLKTKPTPQTTENLALLSTCLDNLNANANATLALSDTFLQLHQLS